MKKDSPRIRSIVKDSSKLRNGLKSRWNQLGLTQQQVADDAVAKGQEGIRRQGISRYLNNPYTANALNEEQIIWLSWRWEVYVTLQVGKPSTNQRVEFKIPETYNEERALKLLKELFPNTILP